ncbi:MAG: 30S ribosomal protein S21 [Bacteroidales bacterium]|nr:30S ribosomal protein S21 [Bacteroidales bacterium]
MLIVPVKEGETVDKALKRYKRKYEKANILKELRERKAYQKPSEKRRNEIQRAIFIQKLQAGLIKKKK